MGTVDITVERDKRQVPISKKRNYSVGPRSKLAKEIAQLNPKESLVTDANVNTIHSHARYHLGSNAIVYRKLPEEDVRALNLKVRPGMNYYRVWRIK